MSGALPAHLPNAAAAVVHDSKITDYLLDPSHSERKADFFMRFGFRPTRWRVLRDALKAHPMQNQVVDVYQTQWGTTYEVQCTIESPDGRNPCIRSFWNINLGATVPKLVSAYARP
jgi:transposase